MAKYRVKTPICKDGSDFAPGSQIELSAEQAAAMPWAVEPLPPARDPRGEKKPSPEAASAEKAEARKG